MYAHLVPRSICPAPIPSPLPRKGGGSGGSHLPKAASRPSPASWHHVPVPAFKQPGWHRVALVYWGQMVQPHGAAPSPTGWMVLAVPADHLSHPSWLWQHQPSGGNPSLKSPQQALWHSGHVLCHLKLEGETKKLSCRLSTTHISSGQAWSAKQRGAI